MFWFLPQGLVKNSAQIRLKVCERLAWLGVKVDSEVNSNLQKNGFLISTPTSLVKVFVIPTNEELMIAEHILDLVSTC
jgi:acetate kinase